VPGSCCGQGRGPTGRSRSARCARGSPALGFRIGTRGREKARLAEAARRTGKASDLREREIFFGNLLVRNHFIIVMIRWTGLAPWECEFLFQVALHLHSSHTTRWQKLRETGKLVGCALFVRFFICVGSFHKRSRRQSVSHSQHKSKSTF